MLIEIGCHINIVNLILNTVYFIKQYYYYNL